MGIKTLPELRRLKGAPHSRVIAAARDHGAKFYKQEKVEYLVNEDAPWAVLDQADKPRLYWAFFPSLYAAALQYCVEHEIKVRNT